MRVQGRRRGGQHMVCPTGGGAMNVRRRGGGGAESANVTTISGVSFQPIRAPRPLFPFSSAASSARFAAAAAASAQSRALGLCFASLERPCYVRRFDWFQGHTDGLLCMSVVMYNLASTGALCGGLRHEHRYTV
jgi:hypothetical protein